MGNYAISDDELWSLLHAVKAKREEDSTPEELEEDPDRFAFRSPATSTQIQECERILGRPFSPSYRHFLSLSNGCDNFEGAGGPLFGTDDYLKEESGFIGMTAVMICSIIYSPEVTFPSHLKRNGPVGNEHPFFLPASWYPFIDRGAISPAFNFSNEEIANTLRLRDYILDYALAHPRDEGMALVTSTQVGSFCEGLWYLEGGPEVTKRPYDQERKFHYASSYHPFEFPDFYAFLRSEA